MSNILGSPARPRPRRPRQKKTAAWSPVSPMPSAAGEFQANVVGVESPAVPPIAGFGQLGGATPATDFFGWGGGAEKPMASLGMQPITSGGAPATGQAGGQWMDSLGLRRLRAPIGGAASELPQTINPEEYLNILRQSPAAMAKMPPAMAASLQAYSADKAHQAEQARAQQALEEVGTTPAVGSAEGAPDVEGTLGRQFTDRYWKGKETAALGETENAFAAQADAIREQVRAGAMSAEGGRTALNNLELKRVGALSAKRSGMADRREEIMMALDRERMGAEQSRYGVAGPLALRREQTRAAILRDWPQQVEAWTNIADWLAGLVRQGRVDVAQQRKAPLSKPGASGRPTLPAGDPGWNFGPRAVPHDPAPAGGGGGGWNGIPAHIAKNF